MSYNALFINQYFKLTMNHQSAIIRIAAAIITNKNQQFILVRKQGSPYFMQAGGKIEPNETPDDALIRELQEELHLVVSKNQIHYLGQYSAPAANEAGFRVIAELFHLPIESMDLRANAELEQVDWFTLEQAQTLLLAPLTKQTIIPILEKIFASSK